MTHSHIRTEAPPPSRNFWLEGALTVAFIVLAALYLATRMWQAQIDTDHLTAQGTISETKIVIDHTRESLYGGLIFYRIEALVTYQFDGQTQSRWLIASEVTTAKELLLAKLAAKPKTCEVYWVPERPDSAKCRFY